MEPLRVYVTTEGFRALPGGYDEPQPCPKVQCILEAWKQDEWMIEASEWLLGPTSPIRQR